MNLTHCFSVLYLLGLTSYNVLVQQLSYGFQLLFNSLKYYVLTTFHLYFYKTALH